MLIFAVLVVHVSDSFLRQYAFGSEYWWVANVYDSAVRWCVPVFVMVSGALLLGSEKEETIAVFYKKRLARIITPILFWSFFFAFIWGALKSMIGGAELRLDTALSAIISGQPYYHMWFLVHDHRALFYYTLFEDDCSPSVCQ
ncbi:MAG: acyltransferase family protein [Ghiorsea sp.]|nr:acyltransferase family protein [Ghiorsea sp.]